MVEVTISNENWVVVSNIFCVHPYLGKIPNLTNIFKGVETTNKKRADVFFENQIRGPPFFVM